MVDAVERITGLESSRLTSPSTMSTCPTTTSPGTRPSPAWRDGTRVAGPRAAVLQAAAIAPDRHAHLRLLRGDAQFVEEPQQTRVRTAVVHDAPAHSIEQSKALWQQYDTEQNAAQDPERKDTPSLDVISAIRTRTLAVISDLTRR